MTIPIYDVTTLPCITYPMKNTQKKTKKFLGGYAMTQPVTMTLNIIARDDTAMSALYDFWEITCNSGLEPFLLPLPIFGDGFSPTIPHVLARFTSDLSAEKNDSEWKVSIDVEVLGTVDYIIDDQGNFIVSDTGEFVVDASGNYVATGNVIYSYREVLY